MVQHKHDNYAAASMPKSGYILNAWHSVCSKLNNKWGIGFIMVNFSRNMYPYSISVNKDNLMLHLSIQRLWKLDFRFIRLYHKYSGKHEANEKIIRFTWLFWISITHLTSIASHGLLPIPLLRIPELMRIISRVGWSENKYTVHMRMLQVLLFPYVGALLLHRATAAVKAALTPQH